MINEPNNDCMFIILFLKFLVKDDLLCIFIKLYYFDFSLIRERILLEAL
jgi:hypothetical protein